MSLLSVFIKRDINIQEHYRWLYDPFKCRILFCPYILRWWPLCTAIIHSLSWLWAMVVSFTVCRTAMITQSISLWFRHCWKNRCRPVWFSRSIEDKWKSTVLDHNCWLALPWHITSPTRASNYWYQVYSSNHYNKTRTRAFHSMSHKASKRQPLTLQGTIGLSLKTIQRLNASSSSKTVGLNYWERLEFWMWF